MVEQDRPVLIPIGTRRQLAQIRHAQAAAGRAGMLIGRRGGCFARCSGCQTFVSRWRVASQRRDAHDGALG